MPGFRSSITDHRIYAPADIEATLGMPNGAIHHLDDVPWQTLSMRPTPALSDYRTPVGGLHPSGAGTHPGGNVTGIPGHNAAQAVLGDEARQAA